MLEGSQSRLKLVNQNEKKRKEKIRGNSDSQSKSRTSCFPPWIEVSEWEDVSQGCFGRYHKDLLCAVLGRKAVCFVFRAKESTSVFACFGAWVGVIINTVKTKQVFFFLLNVKPVNLKPKKQPKF